MSSQEGAKRDDAETLQLLKKLLSRDESRPSTSWDWFISQVHVPEDIPSAPQTSRSTNEESRTVAPSQTTADGPEQHFAQLLVGTGLKFALHALKRDAEFKREVLECFCVLVGQMPDLALRGVKQWPGNVLDQFEEFLCGDDTDAAGMEQNVLALTGLANARGSLMTNLNIAKLLLRSPEALTAESFKTLRKMAETTHRWCASCCIIFHAIAACGLTGDQQIMKFVGGLPH
eukprot:505945-Rhodomonas_salina.1